ncbi:hypothetical protein [Candidatus Poriferisodalis sp.]|uniref:hypothetical protein n=1 Tax=Candidatus Poriferisodalis sp. TaxID=3101277 RepID=UPI003B5C3F08
MRRLTAAMMGLLVSGCTLVDGGSVGCESAAWAQADAEQRWGQAIEAHDAAHQTAEDHAGELDGPDHDASAESIVAARVAMIIAEAETRRECG